MVVWYNCLISLSCLWCFISCHLCQLHLTYQAYFRMETDFFTATYILVYLKIWKIVKFTHSCTMLKNVWKLFTVLHWKKAHVYLYGNMCPVWIKAHAYIHENIIKQVCYLNQNNAKRLYINPGICSQIKQTDS